MTRKRQIALIGNPNAGKTSLFNALVGGKQKVGNWPGVTVSKKVGKLRLKGEICELVDLPGIYSLTSQNASEAIDKTIAQDYLLSSQSDLIVNVLDVNNLQRGLFLTLQMLELKKPMVIALSLADELDKYSVSTYVDKLQKSLGCKVIPVSSKKNSGLNELKAIIQESAYQKSEATPYVTFSEDIEAQVKLIEANLTGKDFSCSNRFAAIRCLEGNESFTKLLDQDTVSVLEKWSKQLLDDTGLELDLHIYDGYFSSAKAISSEVLEASKLRQKKFTRTFDKIALHPISGPLLFLGLIYITFNFSISVGGSFIDFFDIAAQTIFVETPKWAMTKMGLPEFLIVLLADGIGGGIQLVLTFVPIIAFLYFALSFLEDSGYLVRAAFIIDKLLRKMGLPGKAFVPLIVGFGCNVPSISGSRILENPNDRILTVMMAPFMSCGARLAVYAVFAAAFFPHNGQNIVFLLYLIGIAVALLTGYILRKTLLSGEAQPFLMELPTYRIPSLKTIWLNSWMRMKDFVMEAGQIIVVVVVILSFLNSIGTDGSFGNEDSENSVLSSIGKTIQPLFAPMGIEEDNWPAAVGIFTGIFAKEVVVGTLDALYTPADSEAIDEEEGEGFNFLDGLSEAIATIPDNFSGFTDMLADPLGIFAIGQSSTEEVIEEYEMQTSSFGNMVSQFNGAIGAFAYLLLILLYTPCVAVIGAIQRELGRNWMLFSVFWSGGFGYAAGVGFYQIATFSQHPLYSSMWLAAIMTTFIAVIYTMKKIGASSAEKPFTMTQL